MAVTHIMSVNAVVIAGVNIDWLCLSQPHHHGHVLALLCCELVVLSLMKLVTYL